MGAIVIACGLQKSYIDKNGTCYLGESVDPFITRWEEFLKNAKKDNSRIFFTREIHSPEDPFLAGTKTHSLVGTPDIDIPERFKTYIDYIVNTNRFNAFYETSLGSEVHKLKPEEVIIIGVETHTNILFTAEEFRNRGYNVTVPEHLVMSSDDFLHAMGVTLLSNVLSVNI